MGRDNKKPKTKAPDSNAAPAVVAGGAGAKTPTAVPISGAAPTTGGAKKNNNKSNKR
jgi:hypothetical protein